MNSKQVIAELADFLVKESNKILEEINREAAKDTPVKTGYHKSRWRVTKRVAKMGDTGEILNDAPAIGWLEFGGRTTKEHAMTRRAIENVRRDYQ